MTKEEKKKAGIILTVAAIFIALIWLGFNEKRLIVNGCNSVATAYITAEFSETTTGIDYEGNMYTETDYWSEKASDIYYVKMVNDEIIESNTEHYYVQSVAKPVNDIDYDEALKNEPDFDNFKLNKSSKIKQVFRSGDVININEVEYSACVKNLNNMIKVKHWYFISYGV